MSTVTGYIRPKNPNDKYGTHLDILGIGGYRPVQNVAEMNNIPVERRRMLMLVGVANKGDGSPGLYWLRATSNDPVVLGNNANFVEIDLETKVLGGLTYQGNFSPLTGQIEGSTTTITDTPTPSTVQSGHFWIATVQGTYNPGGGDITFNALDWIVWTGTRFRRIPQSSPASWSTISGIPQIIKDIANGTFVPANNSDLVALQAQVNQMTIPSVVQLIEEASTDAVSVDAVLAYAYSKAEVDQALEDLLTVINLSLDANYYDKPTIDSKLQTITNQIATSSQGIQGEFASLTERNAADTITNGEKWIVSEANNTGGIDRNVYQFTGQISESGIVHWQFLYVLSSTSDTATYLQNNLTQVSDLRGIATAGMSVNRYISFKDSNKGTLVTYKLITSTAVDDGDSFIRPDDYVASTNEKVWELCSAGGKGTGVFEPVQDITALKAIDTTEADDYPDKWTILVEDEDGWYRLDRDSTVAESLPKIVAPTTGAGRWFQTPDVDLSAKVDKDGGDSQLIHVPEDSDNADGFFAGLLTLKSNTALLLKTVLDRIVSFIQTDVFKISDVDVSDISEGQFKIPLVQKSGGVPVIQGSSELLDKLATSSILSLLGDNANWGNVAGKSGDFIKLTGDNSNGQLGENSQELFDDQGQYFLCISHILDNPGEATWVRNRNCDALKSSISQDAAVIAELENETGWGDPSNNKIITVRSKLGSWYKSDTSGYLYHCYNNAGGDWYWHRSGLPTTVTMQILNTGNYTALVTALKAHDFTTSDYDPAGLSAPNERGVQGQKYYDVAARELYECVYDEVNAKLIWIKY